MNWEHCKECNFTYDNERPLEKHFPECSQHWQVRERCRYALLQAAMPFFVRALAASVDSETLARGAVDAAVIVLAEIERKEAECEKSIKTEKS